ncbi:uncharacterized protein MONOS_13884 [Monocercomonoides exilis]|uniref:uncharacterized protein n=1 Tax=Monocercomonoides exilis TaxID=2049356 RepID=UPI0035597D31|nr:hypothetical protein MONOS_13884 [Monocercomonoides exilis]|eukprot:MONOS_13884.1-p1 / transcript=MONOS_13884.1 / gene=MONOS_13884 / organism=Monocercomonoides_exilis_PA203 / gene_product=unspecified product / transcript_product=unspecified product / location=Mono_scaffold00898:22886-23871(-) / protein_length=269 / sequence_SO=supercontig / SO=protein_coding / is_pseudo=false
MQAEADEANEMHPPLVAVCWLNCSELMLVMVQLAREMERAGEVAEERTQLVGDAVEVIWVMLEELRVRGFVREVKWKMLWLLRVRLVIAVWLRAREPAVRKKRGVFIVMEVVPVMVVVLRLREGELSERWKRMGVIWFVELWAMARAETVREPWKGEEGVLEKGATHPKAYSTVAHGLCCILPQASTSLPPFATILFWAMRGSQPLYTALSACPLLYTLFDEVVEPHCWNGDWVMLFPLKNTSFPLPFAAVLPSKKQNVMNFIPFIQE